MIENLKDLEKLLKLCRKQGVKEIKHGSLELKLGDLPVDTKSSSIIVDDSDPYSNFPNGELSPTQLAFYSSGGSPENDPEAQ